MTDSAPKVRLFVEQDLAAGAEIALDKAQSNYLFAVMRLERGAEVALFNGRDGEWRADVAESGKRNGALICRAKMRAQQFPPDMHLLFAPLKKARTDFVAEKAAEMGCARLRPVFTRFTNAERVNVERLRAHGVEAAEQCGLLSAPVVEPPLRLEKALDEWDPARRLMFCDEARDAPPAAQALAQAAPGPWAILIGPEGGFAPDERAMLKAAAFTLPVSLGPRVLRADTAVVAALAIWQATLGDWKKG